MDNALFFLYLWLTPVLMGLSGMGLVSDAPYRVRMLRATLVAALHVAFSLGLSAHIFWRRLRWVPVEGEPIIASQEAGPPYPPDPYRSSGCGWRWTYCGVTYTAEDYTPGYCFFVSEKRTTLWVDPRDPSRLLPSTWGLRLFSYLLFGGMSAYFALRLWGVVP